MDVHTGLAELTPHPHSSSWETEKLFISLPWSGIKDVLLKGIPVAGPLFPTRSSSPQIQYCTGQIRTRGGGFQSTWPRAGY